MTAPAIPPRSPWAEAWRRMRRNRMAVLCGGVFAAIVVFCVAGPVVAGWCGLDATALDIARGAQGVTLAHPFGTDTLGRDMLVRTMIGGRIALAVAFIATTVALVIGVVWGAIAAYAGGRTDYLMMRIVDVLYGFPTVPFVIVVMAVVGTKALWVVFALIGAVSWLGIARQTRAQVLSLRHREFVEAARALGARPSRILFGHIVPNALGVVIVAATASLPTVMLTEAFLSYIGLGVQAPLASWGRLVAEGSSQVIVHPWVLIGPGVVMSLSIFTLNFLGDGLRDALDPRTRKD
ncbi:MAG TPA: ABC transporter permease [Kofleriaceae bacterium]|nr:ABC transporter permease [Kofleriaceae bacterium]